jgi:hypothetical protein
LRGSGVLDGIDPGNWIGDKGYIGLGMITPIRKPANRDLLDWEKEFNTAVNGIRWKIEQTIANLNLSSKQNWCVDCRLSAEKRVESESALVKRRRWFCAPGYLAISVAMVLMISWIEGNGGPLLIGVVLIGAGFASFLIVMKSD